MKGHFRKLFGFLASMNSDNYVNYTRSGSGVPLQLPVHMKPLTKERIHVYVIISGEGDLNKHTRFANNITPRRRKSQPVIRDRKETGSEAFSGQGCNFGPALTEDFENEIWSSLQKKSAFSVTSVHDGWLTTTLCSTELWIGLFFPKVYCYETISCGSRDGWWFVEYNIGLPRIWLHSVSALLLQK